ncbi:heterokaryon incompatibility protein-domain-containing protein [Cadophora sp. MPI-SDFR-AT-0126]|nr:heterokaryon incompatibility protein-domain-containing protein [Leotiomycetes sp. MPI-SDFR-AT-0126]
MTLCSICEKLLILIFSGKYSPNREKYELERWYRFPSLDGCQLCRMMETEISKDLIEHGLARISLEGTCDVVQGFVNDVAVFTFPVEMEGAGKVQKWRFHDENLALDGLDWLTATMLTESPVPKSSIGYELNGDSQGLSMTIYQESRERKRVRLARSWIQRCHDEHYLCKPHRWLQFSPTRLIDIEASRLIETRQLSSSTVKYAAFTHCWGPEMPQAGMTKVETLDTHKHNIDFSTLPKSYRDAILVAKNLSIRYIWIDSLCIIQNSLEDWEFESAQMGLVYSHAWCTIASSSAKTCHEGIHLIRSERKPECEFIAQDSQARRVKVRLFKTQTTWETFYHSNPLNKRGWTFQERELSPRVLHFSEDQMWWECRTVRTQEDKPPEPIPPSRRRLRRIEKAVARENVRNAVVYTSGSTVIVNKDVQLRCLDNMLQLPVPTANVSILHKLVLTEARHNTWHRVIEDYSTRTFSRITDRFPALSGLASEIQAAHGGEYVAGAWRDDLLRSLLWRRDPKSVNSHTTLRRPHEYRAPSWSWAAIDEAVTYDLVTLHRSQIDKTAPTTAHISDITLVPKGSDPKGQLRGGFMYVRGKLKLFSFSNMSRDIQFHMDFDSDSDLTSPTGEFDDGSTSIAPLFLLSVFARTAMTGMQQPLLSLNVTGWALVLIMVVEEPEPVFKRVGVACDVACEWFEGVTDVKIKII